MEDRDLKILLVRIPKDLHAEIKSRSALRGLSMASYVERILNEQIVKEKKYYELNK